MSAESEWAMSEDGSLMLMLLPLVSMGVAIRPLDSRERMNAEIRDLVASLSDDFDSFEFYRELRKVLDRYAAAESTQAEGDKNHKPLSFEEVKAAVLALRNESPVDMDNGDVRSMISDGSRTKRPGDGMDLCRSR